MLQASRHQGNSIYKANGQQCVANSVEAILRSNKLPPSSLYRLTFDEILNGDKLLEENQNDAKTYWSFNDIPKEIDDMKICISESLHGLISGSTDLPFYSLNDAMEKLTCTAEKTGCLLTMGSSFPCSSPQQS